MKKSAAGMLRLPEGPWATSSASSATAMAGYSAAGSAWAMDPPMVPRLRIWGWPILAVAAWSTGWRLRTAGESSTSRLLVMAPISKRPRSFSRMYSSSSILPRSMSSSGRAKRMLSRGTRLWPPARILASPSLLASSEIASLSGAGGDIIEGGRLHLSNGSFQGRDANPRSISGGSGQVWVGTAATNARRFGHFRSGIEAIRRVGNGPDRLVCCCGLPGFQQAGSASIQRAVASAETARLPGA